MDTQKTFEWLDKLCEQARDAAKSGDNTLLQRIGGIAPLQSYFNNVFMMGSMPRQVWASFLGHMETADRLREAEEAEIAREQRIAESEATNNALREEVNSLKEQLAAVLAKLEAPAPAKSKKAAKVEEAEQPEATDEETPAESE